MGVQMTVPGVLLGDLVPILEIRLKAYTCNLG